MSFKSLMQSLLGLFVPRNSMGGALNEKLIYGMRSSELGIPNYSNVVSFSEVPFVAPSDGFVRLSVRISSAKWIDFVVDGNIVQNSVNTVPSNETTYMWYRVRKGQSITFNMPEDSGASLYPSLFWPSA